MILRPGVVVICLAVLAAPLPTAAQATANIVRIGLLGLTSREASLENLEALRQGLRVGGWVEGRNIAIEERWADGLMSYGPDYLDLQRRVGIYVDKIFEGC